ncbi:MAG: hypothetical protein B1H13_14020 [Desulfobacteraceae bacterium 4484_190.3]|nr:MAG: hypothetical protein B1H13_14020 [Desulfobacteraceae bacterium 4484_190.3]
MQCKYHPDREAVCECAEEVRPGEYTCFQCAMLQTVTSVGSNIRDRKEKVLEKEVRKKKKWGPFRYFVIVCSVLILSMWGVIIFGGKPAPEQTASSIDKNKAGRVLLFLVNGSIKRYAHYEGNQYPERLADLVPRYLHVKKNQIGLLGKLRYARDPDPSIGYRLSLAHVKKGQMNITLTAGGVRYSLGQGEGT